jgi:hypothetical protein
VWNSYKRGRGFKVKYGTITDINVCLNISSWYSLSKIALAIRGGTRYFYPLKMVFGTS